MREKTLKELLSRKATLKEIKELIKMAENEIKEWYKFIESCKKRIK